MSSNRGRDDQIYLNMKNFDEPADKHVDQEKGKQFWWPSK